MVNPALPIIPPRCKFCGNNPTPTTVAITNNNFHVFYGPGIRNPFPALNEANPPPFPACLLVTCSCGKSHGPIAFCTTCKTSSPSNSQHSSFSVHRKPSFRAWTATHFLSALHVSGRLQQSAVSTMPILASPNATTYTGTDSQYDSDINEMTLDIDEVPGVAESPFFDANIASSRYLTTQQQHFFDLEHQEAGSGLSDLIIKAIPSIELPPGKRLSQSEIIYHLRLAITFFSMTRTDVDQMGDLITQTILYHQPDEQLQLDRAIHVAKSALLLYNSTPIVDPMNNASFLEIFTRLFQRGLPLAFYENRSPSHPSVFQLSRPPMNAKEIRQWYLTGANSIKRRIPVPDTLLNDTSCYAYVDVKQLIAVFVATSLESFECPTRAQIDTETLFGVVPTFYHSSAALFHYKDMRERLPDDHLPVIPIFLKDWNDGAQKAQHRSSDISFEINTFTILTYTGSGDIRYYQFIISLGTKKSDHRSVEAFHNKSFKALFEPTEFYSGYHRQNALFCARVVAGIRDRPARESLLGLPLQNSLFGQCFSTSVYLKSAEIKKLISCRDCFKRRQEWRQDCLKSTADGTLYFSDAATGAALISLNLECAFCLDFNFIRPLSIFDLGSPPNLPDGPIPRVPLPNLNYIVPANSDYPRTAAPGSPDPPLGRNVGQSELPALVDIDYAYLKKACRFATYNWHYKKYYTAHPVAGVRIRDVQGWTRKCLLAYCQAVPLSTQIFLRIQTVSKENIAISPSDIIGDEYCAQIFLPIWYRESICMNVAQEHEALYHAVVHGVGMDIFGLFTESIKLHFKSHRVISETWCSLLVAVGVLQVTEIATLRFTKPSEFSTSGWIGTQKLGLWKIMPALLAQLSTFVETSDSLLASSQRALLFHLKAVGKAMFCLVYRILQEKSSSTSVFILRETVKVLLYRFQELEVHTLVDESKRKLVTTGNHLALLRIPDIVGRFGSLRSFYDLMDEKSVQKVKQRLTNAKMSSPTWLKSILDNCIQEQFLTIFIKCQSNCDAHLCSVQNKYPAIPSPSNTILTGMPFWGIHDTNTQEFLWFRRKDNSRSAAIEMIKLEVLLTLAIEDTPTNFYLVKWDFALIAPVQGCELLSNLNDVRYRPVMFLPENSASSFYMIQDYMDYTVLAATGKFEIPTLF